VNEKAGLTFAVALRAFLRQDPDIIMVGEIRDLETAEIAIKAAQTGHLVLSTLHTNDAPTTLMRLLNMGSRRSTSPRRSSDHRAAARRAAVPALQEPEDIPPEALLRAGSPRKTRRHLGSRSARSAAITARAPATRAASASTR
jgi:type IV pilus assembly protein PilB